MHSIQKAAEPECLEEFKQSDNWHVISTNCKSEIAKQCFDEQNGLCIYCERTLQRENWQELAHCEHMKPRSTYKQHVFDYRNIVLSCNGTPPKGAPEASAYTKEDSSSCGHHRDDGDFIEDLFINPVEENNLDEIIDWDLETNCMSLGEHSPDRVEYMIDTLNLNNAYLTGARRKARGVVRKQLQLAHNPQIIIDCLSNNELQFSSFLRRAYLT